MLIEHTSRSIEDKLEIYVCWCVTTISRMLQPAKSQYGQPTSNVTQPFRTAKMVNSKVNLKVNVVSQQSTQTTAAARSTQQSQSQRFASRIVPENTD